MSWKSALTDEQRERLSSSLACIDYDPMGGGAYISGLRSALYASLPPQLLMLLEAQRASLSPEPYLIVDNIPCDVSVYTTPDPDKYVCGAKSGYLSENVLAAFAAIIGEPYSMFFEGCNLVNNLVPTPATKNDYSGLGSEVELDFHIENSALQWFEDDLSPMGLLFTGVRHDPKGPQTWVADARAAIARLPESVHADLRRVAYRIRLPYRWRTTNEFETDAVPLVRGDPACPRVSAVFYPGMMRPLDAAAESAAQALYAAIREVAVPIEIVPGRLLYIDNRFALHSRDRFVASLDDSGRPLRWIQRVFVAPSLWPHRSLEKVASRVFRPRVAGSPARHCEAGALQ